jgi:serine/threonine protein kinase
MKRDSEQAADESTRTHVSGRGDNLETVDITPLDKVEFIPESFGHFELLEVIGHGGMGVVFRAKDTRLGREVALKKLLGAAAHHPVLRGRFETEAKAIARLHHPNLMPILEYGQLNGQPYFTMPLLSGSTLADCIGDYQNDVGAAVTLMIKVARAVQHAHENQILHRDLKPANVLFDTEGEPIVADFGIAKLQDAGGDFTASGSVLGTPPYMSPEQAAGKVTEISSRSDTWALGIMLYELIVGQRPFKGTTREEITPQVLHGVLPPPKPVSAQVNETLGRIILKCLQKSPDQRYPSAGQLADDLQAWQNGQSPRVQLPTRARQRALTAAVLVSIVLLLLAMTIIGINKVASHTNSEAQSAANSAEPPRLGDALQEMQQELREKGETNPLDQHGRPRRQEQAWITSMPSSVTYEQCALTISTNNACVVELCRGLEGAGFRFHADVWIKRSFESGEGLAGVFIGGSKQPPQVGGNIQPATTETCYDCAVLFFEEQSNDDPPRNGQSVAGTIFCRPIDVGVRVEKHHRAPSVATKAYRIEKPVDGWRSLTWEITPRTATAIYWDGVLKNTTAELLKDLFAKAKINTPRLDGHFPQYGASEGIGLFANKCEVSFRNVWIEVIPAHKP